MSFRKKIVFDVRICIKPKFSNFVSKKNKISNKFHRLQLSKNHYTVTKMDEFENSYLTMMSRALIVGTYRA